MRILYEDLALPVSSKLVEALTTLLSGYPISDSDTVTINFRDPDYSAEAGGYHPVEIRLEKSGDGWAIIYITDFGYVGQGPFTELAKSLDFDFQAGIFQDITGYYPIETASQIYPIWEDNFLTCWQSMRVFEIVVSV